MNKLLGVGLIVGSLIIATQFITVFVIQPIGAVPEGRTVIITRLSNLNFIDSADGWCDRNMGGVSLLCRMMVIGKVGKEAHIIARLPYSKFLYQLTTNGKTYER
jgi:hypothetical protein